MRIDIQQLRRCGMMIAVGVAYLSQGSGEAWAQAGAQEGDAAAPDTAEGPPPVYDPAAEKAASNPPPPASPPPAPPPTSTPPADPEVAPEEGADDAGKKGKMAPNGVYLEALGQGVFYSINYERIFGDAVSTRLGASFLAFSSTSGGATSSSLLMTFPITVSFVGVRSGKHGFEAGGGATIVYAGAGSSTVGSGSTTDDTVGVVGNAFAGYRLHPVDSAGFQLRAGLAIMVSAVNSTVATFPWPYLSVGVGF